VGRPRSGLVVVLVATGVLAASCFGGGGGSASPHRARAGAASNDPGCQFIVAGEAKRSTVPLVNMAEYLIDAAAQPTVCYDKITFTFDKGSNPDLPPSYSVFYKQPPFAPGLPTTAAETLTGVHAILEVMITPASETDVRNPASSAQTYKGNLRLSFPRAMRHTLIVELLRSFPQPSPDPNASVVVWLIGLDSRRPFTTDAANSPPHVNVLILN
jgi:hypothetical protein